jgi:hypothetical protein
MQHNPPFRQKAAGGIGDLLVAFISSRAWTIGKV